MKKFGDTALGKFKKSAEFWLLKTFVLTHERRITLYTNLQMITESGVSLTETTRLLASKIRKHMPHSFIPYILDDWLKTMAKGKTFYQALAPWVPDWEMLLLRAGGSAQISHMLKYVAQLSTNIIRLKKGLSSALRYPVLAFLMLCALMGVFTYYVIPNLETFMAPEKWPPITKNLYILTSFISNHLFFMFFMAVAIVVGTIWSMTNLRSGFVRSLLNRIPPWSIYKQFQSSIFLLSLSSLLRSGISFGHAIETIRSGSPRYISSVLIMMQAKLQAGKRAGEALQSELFDPETLVNLEVYADTDKLEEGIFVLAEDQLEKQIERLAATAKLLGNVVLLIVVGFIIWNYMALIALQSSIAN
jgi:type II secretory pathway component PulF